jgi:hypothetical protein
MRPEWFPNGGHVVDPGALNRMCPYCGAPSARRLGECSVCHRVVCERCGNTQFCRGERRVTHNACLKKADGGFNMIKFVE